MRFNTNAGTISFKGALDPQGNYYFSTNVGTIDVALPGNPSVMLVAATHLGTVDNAFGSTTIGPAPHARLDTHQSRNGERATRLISGLQ